MTREMEIARFCHSIIDPMIARGYKSSIECQYCLKKGFAACRVLPVHLSPSVLGLTTHITVGRNPSNPRCFWQGSMCFWQGPTLLASFISTSTHYWLSLFFSQRDLLEEYKRAFEHDATLYNRMDRWRQNIWINLYMTTGFDAELMQAHNIFAQDDA